MRVNVWINAQGNVHSFIHAHSNFMNAIQFWFRFNIKTVNIILDAVFNFDRFFAYTRENNFSVKVSTGLVVLALTKKPWPLAIILPPLPVPVPALELVVI